jgi:hypothetical protein
VIRTDEQQGAYDVAEHPEGKGTLYTDPVRKPTDGDGKEEREQAEGADNNADHRGGGTQVMGQKRNKGENHAVAGEMQCENNQNQEPISVHSINSRKFCYKEAR